MQLGNSVLPETEKGFKMLPTRQKDRLTSEGASRGQIWKSLNVRMYSDSNQSQATYRGFVPTSGNDKISTETEEKGCPYGRVASGSTYHVAGTSRMAAETGGWA